MKLLQIAYSFRGVLIPPPPLSITPFLKKSYSPMKIDYLTIHQPTRIVYSSIAHSGENNSSLILKWVQFLALCCSCIRYRSMSNGY